MAKSDFISGTVLEFKIPNGLGFAYCKILDFRSIQEFDGVLAKVYDHIVKEPLKDLTASAEKEWLFGAVRMPALPNLRGRGAWKYKGVLVTDDDNIIPDFKYAIKDSGLIEDESTIVNWHVNRNINDLSYEHICTYDQVRHLENTVLTSQDGVAIRTAMEYYRIKGMDVSKYFDLNELRFSNIFKRMMNVPIYKTIPKENKRKGLC
jgi:hypothetical protein